MKFLNELEQDLHIDKRIKYMMVNIKMYYFKMEVLFEVKSNKIEDAK